MRKRAGKTEKVSISVRRDDLAALRKRADRLYDGNVSAVIAELAADARLLEGMQGLADWLGGPSLTAEDRDALDREWRGDPRTSQPKKRTRSTKAKAA